LGRALQLWQPGGYGGWADASLQQLQLWEPTPTALDLRLALGLGLGTVALLGEICCSVFCWCCSFFTKKKKGKHSLGIGKIRKVRAPTWNELVHRKGPWRQACHWFIGSSPARQAGNMRLVGVHGARGLNSCWRFSPLRSLSSLHHQKLKLHVRYLQLRFLRPGEKVREIHRMDHLEGGAAGFSATNRKRQEKKQNSSLIDALSGFLQTWQQGQGDTWQNKPRWGKQRTAPRQTESSMIDDFIQFLHSCKQKQFNDRSVLGCPASTWTGGQWRWTTVRNMHTLVGHIRVSPQIAKTLCAHSGRRGIMVTEIGVNTRDEKNRWAQRSKNAEADQCFASVFAGAQQRQQGLRCRTGGGSDLGMLQLSTDPEENKPMAIDVLGVPAFWDGTDVAKFLEDQGWSSLQVLTRKRLEGRKFKWVLKGMPVHDPQNPQKTTWHYRDNFNPNLNCSGGGACSTTQKTVPGGP